MGTRKAFKDYYYKYTLCLEMFILFYEVALTQKTNK